MSKAPTYERFSSFADMAQAVGELGVPSAGIDLDKICRFGKHADGSDPA